MTGTEYALLAYAAAAVLLGGYALNLWVVGRHLRRRTNKETPS